MPRRTRIPSSGGYMQIPIMPSAGAGRKGRRKAEGCPTEGRGGRRGEGAVGSSSSLPGFPWYILEPSFLKYHLVPTSGRRDDSEAWLSP